MESERGMEGERESLREGGEREREIERERERERENSERGGKKGECAVVICIEKDISIVKRAWVMDRRNISLQSTVSMSIC